MANLFNVLPGFMPSAPGLERVVLRALPRVVFWGTAILAALAIGFQAIAVMAHGHLAASMAALALGILVTYWNASIAIGIAAFIVMVMKGPAYVADAYLLRDSEHPSSTD